MIHPMFSKSEIAYRYYQKVAPERNYSKEAARKQFDQDTRIDKKILKAIIKEGVSEQMTMISSGKPKKQKGWSRMK